MTTSPAHGATPISTDLSTRRAWLNAAARRLAVLAGPASMAGAATTQADAQAMRRNESRIPMNASISPGLQLSIHPAWTGGGPLLVEQAAEFVLTLRNPSDEPVSAAGFSGNLRWPALLLSGPGDAKPQRFIPESAMRAAGLRPEDLKGAPPPPALLAPGGERRFAFNLWSYTKAPGAGRYRLRAEHAADPAAAVLTTEELSFEVVGAGVERCAAGYGWLDRSTSVLAWLAAPPGLGARWRLLVRVSGAGGHDRLQSGSNAAGDYAPDSAVAVSAAMQAPSRWLRGWVAVLDKGLLTLVAHQAGKPLATGAPGAPATPGIDDAQLVPGFPDLNGRALVLLTGLRNGRPVLVGLLCNAVDQLAARWEVSLEYPAARCAAIAGTDQTVTLLYAAEHAGESRLQRLSVSIDGKRVDRERNVATSMLKLRVLQAVSMFGREPMFLTLESMRHEPQRVALTWFTLNGERKTNSPFPLAGWPDAEVVHWAADADARGAVALAITDVQGRLYAGRLDRGVRAMAGNPSALRAPHVVCLGAGPAVGAFLADGRLLTAPVPDFG